MTQTDSLRGFLPIQPLSRESQRVPIFCTDGPGSNEQSFDKDFPTEIYIEAILVDEELADLVWEAWDAETVNDRAACLAWLHVAGLICPYDQHGDNSGTSRT